MVMAAAGENTGQLLLDYHPTTWRDGFQFAVDDMQLILSKLNSTLMHKNEVSTLFNGLLCKSVYVTYICM